MDQGEVHENRHENSGFDYRSNPNSQSASEVLKCCLIKFFVDGTDMMLKDPKSRKTNLVGDDLSNTIDSSQTCWVKQDKVNCKDHEHVNISHVVNSSLAVLIMQFVGFQFNLLVSFFTFPVWFSYMAFMSFMFPLQALRQVRGYLMRKLFRMWDDTSKTVKVKAKNTTARLGCACFWSFYVCFMLFGLLVSGFLFGGFLMKCLLEKPIQTTETLNFDYTKPSPTAFIPIMSSPAVSKDIDTSFGKELGPPLIPYNHRLQVIVSLTVPESEYNRKLGVFQVRVEFLSVSGKATATSKYPCMLRFKSQTIRFAETIINSIPLITGHKSESQVLTIKMNEFTEGLEPTARLKVTLEQRAEFQPGAGIPEIYAATLELESELPQLKRVIWCWRRTIFVCTSIMWFLMELVAILVFCRPMIMPRGRPRIPYGKMASQSIFISWY
ncbi:hypothetical protein PTKIN_Ptkin14bG0171700 [Pterospermum kingtungense]